MYKVIVIDHDNTREEFTSDPREEDDYETPFTTKEMAREFALDTLYEGAAAAMIVRLPEPNAILGEIVDFIFGNPK